VERERWKKRERRGRQGERERETDSDLVNFNSSFFGILIAGETR
jgi:hypothetical protein